MNTRKYSNKGRKWNKTQEPEEWKATTKRSGLDMKQLFGYSSKSSEEKSQGF